MVENLTASGIGVVWSTAYLDEAEACDRVLLLNEGKLLFEGAPAELTGRVADRVFKISGTTGRKREALAHYLDGDGVVDGVIQGDAIRLVMAPGFAPPEGRTDMTGTAPRATVAPPRFEDAFIDMLGGGPGGRSKLAEVQTPFANENGKPVIEAHGLTKRFGDFTAADDISFDIPRGQIFGLLAERRGKVDDVQDAVRTAEAECR